MLLQGFDPQELAEWYRECKWSLQQQGHNGLEFKPLMELEPDQCSGTCKVTLDGFLQKMNEYLITAIRTQESYDFFYIL